MLESETKRELHINWYPGHIAKAEKQLKEKIKLIDFVIEVRDARIPFASHHRNLKEWLGNKEYISVLNKSDLADPVKTKNAQETIIKEKEAYASFIVDSRKNSLPANFLKAVDKLAAKATEKFKAKGILKRPARVMVVGYPNVGKSTIINRLSHTKKAKVENRPGVTQQQQWVKVKSKLDILLLDTPGIIPQKLYSDDQAIKLALANCVSAKSFDAMELVLSSLPIIEKAYPGLISSYYKTDDELKDLKAKYELGKDAEDLSIIGKPDYLSVLIEKLAHKKGWIRKGTGGQAEADMERAALKIISDFREQKFAKINLE